MSLTAQNLSFEYTFRGGRSLALRRFTGEFDPGIPHVICGPSGSGKSTLSLLLAGLLTPSGGEVKLDGAHPSTHRSRIAYVFQFAENIFFEDSLREELEQWTRASSSVDASAFSTMGLNFAGLADMHPFHLSQGTSRLAAIALQIARDPLLLILDEPTIGLDEEHERRVLEALRSWIAQEKYLIVVTHDLGVIGALGGKAWVLGGGTLAWNGRTGDLLADEALLKSYGLEA